MRQDRGDDSYECALWEAWWKVGAPESAMSCCICHLACERATMGSRAVRAPVKVHWEGQERPRSVWAHGAFWATNVHGAAIGLRAALPSPASRAQNDGKTVNKDAGAAARSQGAGARGSIE